MDDKATTATSLVGNSLLLRVGSPISKCLLIMFGILSSENKCDDIEEAATPLVTDFSLCL